MKGVPHQQVVRASSKVVSTALSSRFHEVGHVLVSDKAIAFGAELARLTLAIGLGLELVVALVEKGQPCCEAFKAKPVVSHHRHLFDGELFRAVFAALKVDFDVSHGANRSLSSCPHSRFPMREVLRDLAE
jgi:hypothetical protein